MLLKMPNKGTGAGGFQTVLNGKSFEEKTNVTYYLVERGFKKRLLTINATDIRFLSKIFETKRILHLSQQYFKKYVKLKWNINSYLIPDEAFIIKHNSGKKQIIIIEKKVQNVEGSVDVKLYGAIGLKRAYEMMFDNIEIYYCLCLSDFFKNKFISKSKRYSDLNTILNEKNIKVFFGDDEQYFELLTEWISSF